MIIVVIYITIIHFLILIMSILFYLFIGLSIISFNIKPALAIPCNSDGIIILVDLPSANFSKASKLFNVNTDLSAFASLNNLIPSASACLILIIASASPSAIFICDSFEASAFKITLAF